MLSSRLLLGQLPRAVLLGGTAATTPLVPAAIAPAVPGEQCRVLLLYRRLCPQKCGARAAGRWLGTAGRSRVRSSSLGGA